MSSQPLLIFDLDGTRFGLDATRVRESVWLPELTPAEEAPHWVIGLFILRGRVIPVADLHLRFARQARRYSLSDQVIVLDVDHVPMGIVVNEVRKVINLPSDAIQPPPRFEASTQGVHHLVVGEARVGDDLVAILDVSHLTHLPKPQAHGETEPGPEPGAAAESAGASRHFYPEATPEEREVLRARAVKLREATLADDIDPLGLAVVELGGEYFGIELAAVQEFCAITQLSPVPCCPPHILGAMNLRGDLLTLIDPRAALNLRPAARGGKAVVARLGEQAMGIAVDEVHDVVYLRKGELQAPPSSLRERFGAAITGTAPYGGRTMTVLHLSALLAREEWVVDENVSLREG